MNVTERLPVLQRRAGRRKSTPTSPSSPTFHRRNNRSHDFPVFSPIEPTSAQASSASPSIDLTVPSPTFDLASISPALASSASTPLQTQTSDQLPDDVGKSRPRYLADGRRPATSTAVAGLSYSSQFYQTSSPDTNTARDSPSTGSLRTSSEGFKRPWSRDHDEASAQRAAAFWAQYDSGANEDAMAHKQLVNSKKSRFNLLNPISLLARRRSSQNTNRLEDANVNNLHVPAIPDNFEPSIRGTVVHDFSAPRTRRSYNENSPRPGAVSSPSYPRRPLELLSPQLGSTLSTPASQHSPMFREHFQEEQRPIQPGNTAYLHSQSLQAPQDAALPSFARKLPIQLPDNDGFEHEVSHGDRRLPTDVVNIQTDLPLEPDMPPPPPPPQKPNSPTLDVPRSNMLPKHQTSTSSRFSYMGQQGSLAEEKVLEDKHKEHALSKPAAVRFSMASVDDMDDYGDYDGFDEDDGFDTGDVVIKNIDMPSSQIPVLRTDSADSTFYDGMDEEDEFGTEDIVVRNIDVPTSHMQTGFDEQATPNAAVGSGAHFEHDDNLPLANSNRQSLQAFHFTPQSLSFSPTTTQPTSHPTPRDVEGFPIGTAQTKAGAIYDRQPQIRDSTDSSIEPSFLEGLGIRTDVAEMTGPSLPSQPFDDNDDMYFDGGDFDDAILEANEGFDEDLLDDPSRIRDIPAENQRKYQEALDRATSVQDVRVVADPQDTVSVPDPLFMRGESLQAAFKGEINVDDLTEDNLAAHHDALAMALNDAASKGAFDRTVSFSHVSDDENDSPFHHSLPGVSSRGSKYSNNMISSGISDDDGFGFDDDMDDEAMIAAANAEALENDDDGFYGQEFGFYARAHGRDSAEFSNGGYFTARGSNGVKRSHSGKNNFQEPSLTPITERSEWSTRNSVASLPLHTGLPGMGQPLSSPGIRDLLQADSPLGDDEMSLTALLRLRGKAFGGSSSSINSLADRHHSQSSPLAQLSGYPNLHGELNSMRMSSPIPGMNSLSIAESEDEDDDVGRPTLTQNTPHKRTAEPVRDSSHSSREQDYYPSSPISRKGNHSRNSSGAESVSYARDMDGRWVLERRRTGDSGESEVFEREYLAGARI